ncbi:energy transducer TonB [Bacteroides sp.]
MKLLDYIRGTRKGKEVHRLQKEAMRDPFLADAMDGYDSVEGNQEQQIEALRHRITVKSRRNQNHAVVWSIAASLLLGVCISTYFLYQKEHLPEDIFIALERSQRDTVLQILPSAPPPPLEKTTKLAKAPQKDTVKSLISQERKMKRTVAAPETIAAVAEKESVAEEDPAAKEEPAAEVEADMALANDSQTVTAANASGDMLNEVVVVGYGSQRKPTMTGSVATVEQLTTPQPTVGKRFYKRYLKKKMVRPADGECANVKGEVVLTFHVDKKGRPIDIKVKNSLCPSADEEAVRLVKEGPDWTLGSEEVTLSVKF